MSKEEYFRKHPALHPNFPVLVFAFEAKGLLKTATISRRYRGPCFYCGQQIQGGERWVHSKRRQAHEECCRALASVLEEGK